MRNRTSPISPSDEEVAERKLTEARYSPEALAVRERCLPTCRAGTSIEAGAFQIRPELKDDVGSQR